MATNAYLTGRKKYNRPQAMLWANNSGTLDGGIYVPFGLEVNQAEISNQSLDAFLVTSDHNRQPIDFSINRIEKRERMINGRMRSYHIADKLSLTTSWQMLPSRSFALSPIFDENGATTLTSAQEYTSDGGAGGAELLNWYESHTGSFWVYLAYDKYTNFDGQSGQYAKLAQYNQVIEMYISSFTYSVDKRGQGNHDLWNVSVTLEEV